jgi:dTDP-D-glucose 4,6-dehydratase
LRYALDGGLLKELGWEPKIKFSERIKQVVKWTLENEIYSLVLEISQCDRKTK